MESAPEPKTLLEAIRYFADPDNSLNYVVSRRWPNGVTCPTCGTSDVRFISTRRIWECKTKVKHPRKQFSVKIGTIFEDSPIGLDKWLAAVWLIANCKNGVSSYEIHRDLGVTQKTAWFMLHRIRLAMQDEAHPKFEGEVEADETFVGGKARNMHASQRKLRITGTGHKDKVAVLGILQRGGKVRTKVVSSRKKHELQTEIKKHVVAGSALFTDALKSYDGLNAAYVHQVIDHAVAYVDGKIHTNGIENFWSLVKRMLGGTYISVEPYHLFRYLDEQTFRFNTKEANDAYRFDRTVRQIVGRRLTYKELTGKLAEC